MSLFRNEVLQARKNRWLGDVILSSPPSLRITAYVALTILVSLLLFLVFFSWTKKQRIEGVVMPDTGIIKVYSPQTGIIIESYVSEGEQVEAGAPLYLISSEKSLHDDQNAQKQISAQINHRLAVLNDELSALDGNFEKEKALTGNHIRRLTEQLKLLERQIANQRKVVTLGQGREKQYQDIYKKEYISLEQLQRVQEEALQQRSRLDAYESEKINLMKERLNREGELQQNETRYLKQKAELERTISLARQELTESESKREILIQAPESGTVTAVTTKNGQFFDGRAPLLSIVPENAHLQALLYAPSSAVGFVREGAEVWLRYQAYPWQKFGRYRGTVKSVSRVALSTSEMATFDNQNGTTPLYQIVVVPDSEQVDIYGEKRPIQAGMQLEADVVIDKRKLWEWVFEPLLKYSAKHYQGRE